MDIFLCCESEKSSFISSPNISRQIVTYAYLELLRSHRDESWAELKIDQQKMVLGLF